DAVAPTEKKFARDAIGAWLGPQKNIYLRVNAVDSEWFAGDVELLHLPGVAGVMLPKTETSEHIATVLAHSSTKINVVPLIETAVGLWQVEGIARTPGVELLAFGSIDFQLDTGIIGDDDALLMARSQ